MIENENDNKAGIYFCIDITKKLGYIIIWSGKFSYQYSKLSETNESMLLTLIRYGFYLSSNSIICLTNNEVDDFDMKGFEIFQDDSTNVFQTETNTIEINNFIEKNVKVNEKKILKEGTEKLKNIIKSKINQKNLIFFKESNKIIDSTKIKNKNFFEFIRNESKFDLYFEDSFEIQPYYF